jgi:hypothetical protein
MNLEAKTTRDSDIKDSEGGSELNHYHFKFSRLNRPLK